MYNLELLQNSGDKHADKLSVLQLWTKKSLKLLCNPSQWVTNRHFP